MRAVATNTRLAKRRRFRPFLIALDPLDIEAGGLQRGHILFAGCDQIIDCVMEDIEIVREAGGILRRIQHESARKVAGLRTVAHQHSKNFLLKRG